MFLKARWFEPLLSAMAWRAHRPTGPLGGHRGQGSGRLGAILGATMGGCGGHTLGIGLGLARGRTTLLRGRVIGAGSGSVCAGGSAIRPLAQRLVGLGLFIVGTDSVCTAATTLPRRHAARRA